MKKPIDNSIPKKHDDLLILADALKFFNFDFETTYLPRQGYTSKYPELRGSHCDGRQGNYINLHGLNAWGKDSEEDLKATMALANQSTKEYNFELAHTHDMEWDDDRVWYAGFTFFSNKK